MEAKSFSLADQNVIVARPKRARLRAVVTPAPVERRKDVNGPTRPQNDQRPDKDSK